MSNYYKDFLKPRGVSHSPLSFGFYKKNYALVPLLGLLATSMTAVAFMSVHKLSDIDVKFKNKDAHQEKISNAADGKQIDARVTKIFPKNSELRALYLDMAKAESQARMKKSNSERTQVS